MKGRNVIISVIVIALVIAGIVFLSKGKKAPIIEPLTANYVSEKYAVAINYPEGWTPIPGEEDALIGESGISRLGALGGDTVTLEDVVNAEANHRLQPYGISPILGNATIDGQSARYIFPGQNQPLEMYNQAAVIVQYPKPVIISGAPYHYFILWADQSQIQIIANTIKFVDATSTAQAIPPSAGRGALAGQVKVLPVCPIEREDEVCTPSATLYTGEKVYVYSKTTKAQIARLPIKEDGTYRLELAPGSYMVDMPKAGIRRTNLPLDVVVVKDKTIIQNILIDRSPY